MSLFHKFLIFLGVLACTSSYAQTLSVKASVEHAEPNGTDTDGSIRLTVTGGTAPYTYTWSPGAITTKDIINVAKGTYTLTVKDAAATTKTYTYTIGSKAHWADFSGTFERNDSLIHTGDPTANTFYQEPTAVSKNALPANTDGWVEYVATQGVGIKIIGLLDSIGPYAGSDIDYALNINNLTFNALRNGTSVASGTFTLGDVFRLERTGTTYRLKKNGTAVYTTTLTTSSVAKPWKVKACFQTLNSNFFEYIGCSFENLTSIAIPGYVLNNLMVVHSSGPGSTDGSIVLSPRPTGATRTYTWQGGATTNSISAKAMGTYSVTAGDADNNTSVWNYNIGYKVRWNNFYGCVERNDSLIQTLYNTSTTTALHEYYAISKNTLAASTDGWMEYVVPATNVRKLIGFTDSIGVWSFGDILYGLQFNPTARVVMLKNGLVNSAVGASWNCDPGDVFRLERVGNTFRISKNGGVVYSETIATSHQGRAWKIKANFQNAAVTTASFERVGCSFDGKTNTNFTGYVVSIPVIKGVSNTGVSDASISLSPRLGGTNTYTWQGGATTNSVSAQAFGTYTVNVKDGDNNSSNCSYNLGYMVKWNNLYGTFVRNDSLIQTAVVAAQSGFLQFCGLSKNTLPAGGNGWVEWVWNPHNGLKAFGMTDSIVESNYTDIEFGLYMQLDRLYYIREGVRSSAYGEFWYAEPGDVLRIEKLGSTIRVMKNGGVLLSETMASTHVNKPWKVKVNFQNATMNTFGPMSCSFDNKSGSSFKRYVQATPATVHALSASTSDGKITLSPRNSSTAQTYQWSALGITSATVTNLAKNSYSVNLTDVDNNTNGYIYDVGYKTDWGNFTGCVSRNDSLIQTTTSSGVAFQHDYSAVTKNYLPVGTDGWVQYVVSAGYSESRCFGFLDTLTAVNYSDVDYGVIIQGNGWMYLTKDGTRAASGAITQYWYYRTGDEIRLARVGTEFRVYKNGGLIYTETIPAAKLTRSWKVKATFYNPTKNFFDYMGCSFPSPTSAPNLAFKTAYALLKPNLDNGYYNLDTNKLRFVVTNQYASSILQYKIYNNANTVIYSNTTTAVPMNMTALSVGDNRFVMDFGSLGLATGYYILEVTSDKNEKTYLRFRK